MAKTIKLAPFDDEEKAALRRQHLRPEEWEPVWRGDNARSFIARHISSGELRTIDKRQIPNRLGF